MYPTDLTLTQWQFIKKTLDFDDRKRKHDLCIIWNAIYYIVKTGCQWRMLPSNYPKWQLVYYYYSKWSNLELFDLLLTNLREEVRVKRGQNAEASLGIIDSQSVRWGNNRSLNGFDGNKKVKGIKRHVVVDKNGFLLAVMVSVANFHDSKAALLLMRTLHYLLVSVKVILADGGYRGNVIEEIKNKFGYIIQLVLRSDNKEKLFKPVHKRWIVERTFSWFDNDRRLCRNYELLMENSENMVKLSAIKLLLNKI
ncbi:IS5 family transposase [Chryseobacterium sp. Ch-15]|uniref:IS5 family transposase n=1 Tax=Chryseobacterium muglaense TaxID=2893752 RepID=A0A9Q3YXH1_9FLAO|nr:IS5 family transposase [Chryseobacterium muglaense]MBD3906222.1 IS5 family transposase [Chryseobacterium muglaense]MCC9036805.1 IS5 family transposase [Chryseobacterium muglaense]MCM2555986.1 IS5 family transposase [Chryseobacterium muglaense]